jgi:membrane protease YdiL (CAAX protease family)
MKRVFEFVRSVTPADPWQLLYIAGAVFLFISPRLTWLIAVRITFAEMTAGLIPVVIAGVFAYYGCFQTGERPLQRLALSVFLPAFLGFAVVIGEYTFFDNQRSQSLFAHRSGLVLYLEEWAIALRAHPPGLSLALIALAMVGVFALRMHLGISSLPLQLEGSARSEEGSREPWSRVQWLIFVLVCPLFLLERFSWTLLSIPTWWSRFDGPGFGIYIVFENAAAAALLVLVAILIVGKSAKEKALWALQLPKPRYMFLGLMLPVVISLLISSSQYGYDRIQWARNDFGRTSPPQFAGYFSFNSSWHWSLLLVVFAALAEEIIFRGILLAPLLRRYGWHRGIFLTGLIWAAFHFHGDMHLRYSMAQVLLQLVSRIAICLAMNYVLSWMTLQWKSVIPAAVAHTISNVIVVGRMNGGVPFAHEIRVALWAVCALVLFHYWPIGPEDSSHVTATNANPEPAV